MEINVDNIKRRMLIKYPFFGSAAASLKLTEVKGLGTVGTDENNIFYDPEFLKESSEEKQTFIFAHEVCHVAFNHILRSEGKNQNLWNIATDAVINAFLEKDGLPIPEDGIDEEYLQKNGFEITSKLINYNAEQLYNELEKQQKEQQDSEKDAGHDTHKLWKEAIKRHQEGKENNKQPNEKDNKTGEEMAKEKLKELQAKLSEMGEKDAFKKNDQTRKNNLEELLDALSKESMNAGDTTNSEIVKFEDIGTSKPLVDWRLWLREAISMDVDWSFQNAEIEDGVVRPNLEAFPIPETEILLDTSGSVSENLLKNFLRECKNILQASRVKVGCFDTEFYGWNEVRTLDDIDNLPYVGRGGTDFDVAVNAFTKRVENKIIFTDGDAPMPDNAVNAIWIIYGGKKINPPGGRVIYITREQLRKILYESNPDNNRKRM